MTDCEEDLHLFLREVMSDAGYILHSMQTICYFTDLFTIDLMLESDGVEIIIFLIRLSYKEECSLQTLCSCSMSVIVEVADDFGDVLLDQTAALYDTSTIEICHLSVRCERCSHVELLNGIVVVSVIYTTVLTSWSC